MGLEQRDSYVTGCVQKHYVICSDIIYVAPLHGHHAHREQTSTHSMHVQGVRQAVFFVPDLVVALSLMKK